MQSPHAIDVVSSGIHDVKNELFGALTRLDALLAAEPAAAHRAELRELRGLIERGAGRLSEMLSTYRVLRRDNPVSLLPVYVPDFLADLRTRLDAAGADDRPSVELVAGFRDHWFFDRELIGDCLVNAVQNARRQARARIVVEAAAEGDYLRLSVADDGPGYPEVIPGVDDGDPAHTGLFLARRLAALHQRQGRRGRLLLTRCATLGGARFVLFLP